MGRELQLFCMACEQSMADLVVSQKKTAQNIIVLFFKIYQMHISKLFSVHICQLFAQLREMPVTCHPTCGINRLDGSNSCPSYTTAVTRFAGSATWEPWDRWQQGQQGSWSTVWSLPLLEQVQNAIFKDLSS